MKALPLLVLCLVCGCYDGMGKYLQTPEGRAQCAALGGEVKTSTTTEFGDLRCYRLIPIDTLPRPTQTPERP